MIKIKIGVFELEKQGVNKIKSRLCKLSNSQGPKNKIKFKIALLHIK